MLIDIVNFFWRSVQLGVVIDSHLLLSAQVAAVCRSGYYQLRQLRPLVRSMSAEAGKTLLQAFISCRMDNNMQLPVLRHQRRSDEPAAVFPGGCTFGVRRSTLRAHHASATGAALASGSTSGGFQDGQPFYFYLFIYLRTQHSTSNIKSKLQ